MNGTSSRTRRMPESDALHDAAADWHDRLEDASPATRAEFDIWLAAHPRHRVAFEATERMWTTLGNAHADPRILALRQKALSAAPQTARWPRFAAAAAAAALMGCVTWLAWSNWPAANGSRLARDAEEHVEGGSLRTAVGERSNLTLSDGSIVVLNTRSQVDIRFTADARRVRLSSGQAWFQVAKNPSRPFIVEAGDRRVIALGTAFDVRIDAHRDAVQVTLAEGRVAVEPIVSPLFALLKFDPKDKSIELAPGESLIASADAPADRHRVDVDKIVSWRQGKVVFDNDTLDTAVAELNRYSSVQIELADPSLAAYRVSGVFKAGHSESFIETLMGHYPIAVSAKTDRRIVLASKK